MTDMTQIAKAAGIGLACGLIYVAGYIGGVEKTEKRMKRAKETSYESGYMDAKVEESKGGQ